MVCLSRLYPFKFFKGCLPQILFGPLPNTLSRISRVLGITKSLNVKGGKPQFSVSSIWGNVHTDFVQQDSHLLKIAYTACLCKSTALLVSCKLHKTFRFKTVRFIKLVIFHKFYTSFYTIPHKNLK